MDSSFTPCTYSLLLSFCSQNYSKAGIMTFVSRVLFTRPRCREFGMMMREHDFVIDLAKAGKMAKEIKELTDVAHGGKALTLQMIYKIVARVRKGEDAEDRRGRSRRRKRMPNMVKAVKTFVEEDRRVCMENIMEEFDISCGTVFNILHDDLELSKKSSRWVPHLLSEAQKEERICCAKVFKKELFNRGDTFLNSIITMDKSMVPFFTPKAKQMSKQWVAKGSPAPIKAKVQESRKKQI